MKVNFEQLDRSLQNKILPCYLISGDENLFVSEACRKIRKKAQSSGFSQTNIIYVEGANFDWQSLLIELQGLSLFAERSIFEIRLTSPKIGDKGSKAMQEIIKLQLEDKIIIVSCGKLTSQQQNSAWFKLWSKEAVIIQIWPATPTQVKNWMIGKFQQRGMTLDTTAMNLLLERIEGNLLAAAQEVEKLYLNFGASAITVEQVYNSVTDNARFSIFDLVDELLAGDNPRAINILNHIKSEGVEPILIIWALARELRILVQIQHYQAQGLPLDLAMTKLRQWAKRKPLIQKGIQRLSQPQLYKLLQHVAKIDQAIKGQRPHALLWHEIFSLCMEMTGAEPSLPKAHYEAENL